MLSVFAQLPRTVLTSRPGPSLYIQWTLSQALLNMSTAPYYDNTEIRGIIHPQIQRNTTPMYRAPEMVDLYSNMSVTEKADIWVSLWSLCQSRLLWFFLH